VPTSNDFEFDSCPPLYIRKDAEILFAAFGLRRGDAAWALVRHQRR
jgi:hypothetical protein